MLASLVRFSIRFRGLVMAAALLLSGYGVYTAFRSKLDVFPEFAPPQIVLQTEAPGLSPGEVEQLVTRPVELALNGTPGLAMLRSQSIQGLSVVTATFFGNTDIFRARQVVSERLAVAAGNLPRTVHVPAMEPLTSATSIVLVVGLDSDKRSLMDVRTFADYELKPRLLGVPGAAKAAVFGGEVRQFQIELDPERMKTYGVSLEAAARAAARATGVLGGGFIETAAQRITVKTEGQALTAAALGETVVRRSQGMTLSFKDLGRVIEGPVPRFGSAQIMGRPGVILNISEQYGANTLEVTRGLEKALAELRPLAAAEGIRLTPDIFRPATFVETAVGNIRASLFTGGILVVIVLFLFLWNVRTSLISLSAIPVSLLISVIVLDKLGISLNTMTLGGLAIAIGEVVDDAIIDVENIYRRLRENLRSAAPLPPLEVAFSASLEVRSAVVYATWVVILVFLPVVTMGGVQGRLFAPLGLAYIASILASLLVALTLTPAMSAAFLSGKSLRGEQPGWITALKSFYAGLLARILPASGKVLLSAAFLVLAAAAAIPFLSGSFVPELQEGHFIIHMSAIPGTSLAESMRLGGRVTAELEKLPQVRLVAQRAGRAESGDDIMGTHDSEFEVDLKPLKGDEAESVRGGIQKLLSRFPGVYFSIQTFLSERIDETISGSLAQVVVKIFGDDLDVLDRKAKEVAGLMAALPGSRGVQIESQSTVPELVISLKEDRLARYGISPAAALEAVEAAYQGNTVAQVYRQNRVTDVVVRFDRSVRQDPERLGGLLLENPDGNWVRLGELADIRQKTGRYVISRENTRRLQVVTCNVSGRGVSQFTAELQRRLLKDISFPPGVTPEIAGEAQAQSAAHKELLIHSLAAGAGIILLLWIVFADFRNLVLVLCNIPFALVGGVLAVFAGGGLISLGSMVGFVTLFGITTRNSIMLISHYKHLVASEKMDWGAEAAARGAQERLLPILMTALVTGLGLLPIAIGSGSAGREVEGPMAIVILGGLVTSTALNLLVLPALALRFGRFKTTRE